MLCDVGCACVCLCHTCVCMCHMCVCVVVVVVVVVVLCCVTRPRDHGPVVYAVSLIHGPQAAPSFEGHLRHHLL